MRVRLYGLHYVLPKNTSKMRTKSKSLENISKMLQILRNISGVKKLNEQLQCCDKCTPDTANWIFIIPEGMIAVCPECYDKPGLKEITTKIWNVKTGDCLDTKNRVELSLWLVSNFIVEYYAIWSKLAHLFAKKLKTFKKMTGDFSNKMLHD